jgi:hypothetical protein
VSGEGDWVPLASAADDIEAHLVTGALAEEGIEVHTEPLRSGSGDYLFGGSNPHAPIRLFVREAQLEEARALMDGAARAERTSGSEADQVPLASPGGPWRWALAVAVAAVVLVIFVTNIFRLI